MNGKTADFFRNGQREIMPYALSAVLSLAVFSVYSVPLLSLWTAGILLVTAIIFLICRFTDKHHMAGGAIITILALFLLRTFIILVLGNDWGTGFQQWFLTGAEKADTQFDYLFALLISFVPFFALTVYYFSCVLYRMSFLTLVSLIPCALSVKVLTEINNVYVALIAMLNIGVLMTALRTDKNRERVTSGRKASVFSACIFGFVLLLFSAFFPKESEARYYDRFEQLFMNSDNSSPLSDYSLFSDFSGGPDYFRNFSNKYLYMLYGENVPYFKRQTFDLYDFENLRWYSDEYYSEPYYLNDEWAEEHSKLSLQKLKECISSAEKYSPGFVNKYGLSKLYGYEGFTEELKVVNIVPENFGAVYYIAPARAVKVVPSSDRSVIYVTRNGVFRNKLLPHNPELSYQVMYFDEFFPRYYWLELGGANFSNEKCAEMLTDLCGILSDNNDSLYENAAAFLDVHTGAMDYRTAEYEENCGQISPEIKALAEQITAGLTYDWQKAEALQSYFTNYGYIYDLNYIPSDPSVEYFLFESKKGSCTHFATAYVLMARSIGLTARYTEGYSPDITSRENVFVIKDSCSHAYPEVYIQNMGWIVFEPTVASDYNNLLGSDNANAGFEIKIDYSLVFVICVISGAALIISLIVIFTMPVVLEKRFISRINELSPVECIKQIYLRISRKTVSAVIKRAEALTPFELAERIEKLTGCETGELAYITENAIFDGYADETGKQKACKAYIDIRDAVKLYVKEQKKQRRKKYKSKGKAKNEK